MLSHAVFALLYCQLLSALCVYSLQSIPSRVTIHDNEKSSHHLVLQYNKVLKIEFLVF